MIPKIIWQTDEKPYNDLEPFKKNIIETWKNLNPSWEHRYVDSREREAYVKKHNSTLYNIYKISSGVNQADIWRILIIYNNGGLYADMDSIAITSLDDIITKRYKGEDMICTPIGFQTLPGTINISNFAAIKNSKTIKCVLDEVILRCEKMIEYESIKYNDESGTPVHKYFSSVALKHIESLCFMDDYFSHSHPLKFNFNLDQKVYVKGQTYKYSDLIKINNWTVY
jgi:hypothetical protein